jgi:hypothetical protein
MPFTARLDPKEAESMSDQTAWAVAPARVPSTRTTRTRLLKNAAISGGVLAGGGLLAGGLTTSARSATSAQQDARVFNFILLIEYLEAAFYAEALKRKALSGELRTFAEVAGAHEQAHVDFLKRALGSKARAKPALRFGSATRSPAEFVKAAIQIEDTTVGAYNGQASNLTSGSLAAAAKIVSVEARHAAWIRDIAGKPPASDATDPLLSERDVRARLKATGFLRG